MGSTIKIYLQEDLPTGIRKLELIGWTGVALAFPQTSFTDVKNKYKSLMEQPGVYILCWRDEDRVIQEVYIGESSKVLDRVKGHIGRKGDLDHTKDSDWTDVVLFYTSDDNLNSGHVEDLEAGLLRLVGLAKRVEAPQLQQPLAKLQSDSDKDYVADFVEKIKLLLPMADVDIFAPRTAKKERHGAEKISLEQKRFVLKGPDYDAYAEIVGDQWVVLAESAARIKETKSFENTYSEAIRHKLVEDGVLVIDGEYYRFSVDRAFKSPSQAAEMVLGRSANGRSEWKHALTGQSFDEWEKSQLSS